MNKHIAMLTVIVGTCISSLSYSEEDSSFALGVGLISENEIYKGMSDDASLMPFIAFEKGSFYIQGLEAGYHFIDTEKLKFGVLARYRMDGYSASDSDDLAGMDDRDGAFELGLSTSYESDMGEWSVAAYADSGSTHKGYELELMWENRFRLSEKWSISPEATLSYRSEDLNNYYYGVKASEATIQRAVYNPGSNTTYELGLNADYMIDRNQMVRIGASYESFSSEISDSSIVDDDSSMGLKAFYIYRF